MKRGAFLKISVVISPEAEEAVAELLENLFHQLPAIYTDAETRATTGTVYCPGQKSLPRAKRVELMARLKHVKQCGLRIGSGRIVAARIKPEDWADSWKRHFHLLEFGRALLVKPSWIRRRRRRNQAVVVLDPGLSFGTGQHPTTAFCLMQLVAGRQPGQAQSFLDIGTGSGILAIAAAKLGYAPVRAFDFDPEAIRVARANARRNRVQHKLHIGRQDLAKLPLKSRDRHDVVCANLTADLLFAEQKRILNRLQRGGRLVLAGILRGEFARVQRAFEKAGLRLIASRTKKEWKSGAFRFAR